ncbi:MAG: hypothetical protein L0Z49_04130 [Actinobacteria bacterium]|nr:hypothetical protein [Actinomycetota bacterium]MCI0677658.1 hypothetical protein [Actinomycetota bacterium]
MSLLVGTAIGLIRLEDGARVVEGTRINHVARLEDEWWAVDGKGRIHHEGEVVAALPESAKALCIQPTPETVWVGADAARLYAVEGDLVTEDEFLNTAPGRDRWYTPWGGPPAVRSMALDADRTLYVNVHVGGLLRYDDTGLVPTVDIDSDVHQVTAHPTLRGVVYAATGWGLAQTHNGHDFTFLTEGLHANYCRAVAVIEDIALVSASTGPDTQRARIYRTSLDGGPLIPTTEGLPEWFSYNLDTHCLAVRSGSVYVGMGDTVWASVDLGESWVEAMTGLPTITCLG